MSISKTCWPVSRQDDAVLGIDETGVIKKGTKSVGVARQYCGASGKLDNCQVGVFLSWQTAKGHALLDRALYLPQEWIDDPPRCRAAGIPEEVTFATKPELARRLVERALEAGARPAWVVADSVYYYSGRWQIGAAKGSVFREKEPENAAFSPLLSWGCRPLPPKTIIYHCNINPTVADEAWLGADVCAAVGGGRCARRLGDVDANGTNARSAR